MVGQLVLVAVLVLAAYAVGYWIGRRQGYDEAIQWRAHIDRMAAMLEISHGNGGTTVD